jgi:ankyrin repeat protein
MKAQHIIEQEMSNPKGASVRTVDNLYATIFDGILKTNPQAYNVAAQTFRLMLCLHETISPATLLVAASITQDGSQNSLEVFDLLRICSHLVVLDDELDTIRFAHASVQEYLSRLPEFSMADANSAAASSCLIRCSESPLPDLTLGVQPSHDFDVYAAMYWPLHYNAASERDRNGYLGDTLKEFMFSDQDFMSPFPSWIETVDKIAKTLSGPHARLSDLTAIGSEDATPLFTACLYGLEFAIEILSGMSSFDVNQKNACGHTGLYLASAAGQIRVVDGLLKLGADIAIEGGRNTTPLQVACANGHGDIAQLIVNFPSQNPTAGMITSAIQAALRNGHEDVVVILLKNSALPISQDTLDQVFEAAAGMGFTELMDYLHLTSKSLSGNRKPAIKGAIRTFHDSKHIRFREYFENKALPNDAVATAAFYGQNKIIEICLDKGLDIEHEGPFGTPLRAASLMGHGTTVRFLLDKNAVVDANGSFGDALQAAAMRGHLSITTTLIRSGAAVDNSGGFYGNALQAATYRGHIDVVKALLAAGASIGQNGLFNDALSAAVSAGNQSIAHLLLRSGYQSPHLLDEDKNIMLGVTRHRRRPPPSHVDLLSALHPTRYSKRTPHAYRVNAIEGQDLSFEEAYKSIHEGIEVKRITELADFEHRKRFGSHALLVATATGQESVVRCMLEYRSAIGLSLLDIGILLRASSAAGQLGIVDYVLSLPELPRKHIPRALERAAWYDHVAITKRLLECEEAYGPPPDSYYVPFTTMEDRQCKSVFSDKKKSRWSDYFPLSYQMVETNETAENGHIMRILLLGCRANAPATVELALQLAAESGLQNLFATALAITIGSNSERSLEVLFRHYPTVDEIMLKKACAQAEKDGSLRVLYVLLQYNSDHGYQVENYWNVYDGAARNKHNDLISYLHTQTLHWQDDSVFARTFVEAAQRGYVSALNAWEERLFQFANHELLMSQALDQACANGHAVVASYLIERGVDVNTSIEEPIQSSSLVDHRSMFRHDFVLTKSGIWPRTAL